MALTRRAFLRTGWKVGGTLLGAAAAWTVYESLRPLGATRVGTAITLGDPANYPAGTATFVSEGRLYVANADGNLFSLSQKCPHLGCRVLFCDSSGHFECPCHGSKFDIGGEWIEGPAPRGMDRFRLRVDGGVLVADTATLIAGPDRGAKRFFKPAKGPPCGPQG